MNKSDKNCRYLNLYSEDFGYSRVWKPAKNIIGEAYQIPSWDRPSYGLDRLLEKIQNLGIRQ